MTSTTGPQAADGAFRTPPLRARAPRSACRRRARRRTSRRARASTAKTPPATATSSPKNTTRSSEASASSSASRMALRKSVVRRSATCAGHGAADGVGSCCAAATSPVSSVAIGSPSRAVPPSGTSTLAITPSALRLVHDRGLVRLDLGQRLAARERLPRPFEPLQDRPLLHRVGQLGHRRARPSVLALELAEGPRLGERRREPALLISASCTSTSASTLVDRWTRPRRPLEPRAQHDERVALAPPVELALGPVLAGIAARVADEAVGDRLDEVRPAASTRMLGRRAPPPRARSRRSMPSIVSAGTSITSARARIGPAVTDSNAVYSP